MRQAMCGVIVVLFSCGDSNGVTHDASPPGTDDATQVMDASTDGPPDGAVLPTGAMPLGLCRDGWCWVRPLPQGETLTGLWGSSSTNVYAIGQRNSLLHWNGSDWNNIPVEASHVPLSIWGSGANDVYVAATDHVLHWDGTAWGRPSGLTTGTVDLVGGTGANNVLIQDLTNNNFHAWNGTVWTDRAWPTLDWLSVAVGGDAMTTVSLSTNGGVAKWLGSTWGIADPGTHPANAGVVFDGTHAAIATETSVWFWDGISWTEHAPPAGQHFLGITGTSLSDVWVTGRDVPTASAVVVAYHWDGTSWSGVPPIVTGQPGAMWTDENGRPWGIMGRTSVRMFDGLAWMARSESTDIQIAYGTAEDDEWSVTSRNDAIHWNGSGFTTSNLPQTDTRLGIWGANPSDYWIAGGKRNGTLVDGVLLHWNGTAWSSTTLESYPDSEGFGDHIAFTSIWGSGANDVYAISKIDMYHWDGTDWVLVGGAPGGSAIFGSSATDIYVLNGTATINHWDGAAWTQRTAPSMVTSGWENSPTDIWLGGNNQSFWYDGSVFVSTIGGAFGKTDDMYTFSLLQMAHYSGGGGTTPLTSDNYFRPTSGWKLPNGRVYAVANGGLLVH